MTNMLRYACLVSFTSPEAGPDMPPLPFPFDKWEVLQTESAIYPPAPEKECIVLVGYEASESATLQALSESAESGQVVLADQSFEKAMRDALPALKEVVTVLGPLDW